MNDADCDSLIALIAELWPWQSDQTTGAQASEIRAHIRRMNIDRAQGEAIARACWRTKPGGYAPLDAIFKKMEVAHGDRRIQSTASKGGEGTLTLPEWLERFLSDSCHLYGYAGFSRTPQHLDLSRRAKGMGIDLVQICSDAMGIPYETAHKDLAEYGQAYRQHQSEAESRWAAYKVSRRQILGGYIGVGEGSTSSGNPETK